MGYILSTYGVTQLHKTRLECKLIWFTSTFTKKVFNETYDNSFSFING